MPEPIDAQQFAGPHPTCREFAAKMAEWGFRQCSQTDVHTIFRGPHGGRVRVLRSQTGRADPIVVEKVVRLASLTPEQFWAGPHGQSTSVPQPKPGRGSQVPRRKPPAGRDAVTSRILAIHAEVDRPLGFDQVAEMAGVTRGQAATASAALCRDGQLHRIRSGVYQWSEGQLAAARRIPASPPVQPVPPVDQPAPAQMANPFSHLVPAGVQLNGELLADLEQWARLTRKLTARNGATH